MIKVKVPATTANMGPGFDCLGAALAIYNIIEVEETNAGLTIEIHDGSGDSIPTDETNLVYQAMKQVFDQAGYSPKGLRIVLTNNIPLTRGLGSSAACIAGGMTAANVLAGNPLGMQQIIDMAVKMEGHPDNTLPALMGGITVACMEGEKVHYVKMTPPDKLKCAVMIPDFQLSTTQARNILPKTVSMMDAVHNVGRASLLVASLFTGNMENLMAATQDRLHQPYRKTLIPHWDEITSGAKRLGACGVFLSGAGPTVIALLDGRYDEFLKEMQSILDGFEEHWEIQIVDICKEGIKVYNELYCTV